MQHWLAGHKLKNRPYEILQVLGEGGFGITYKAKNLNLEVPVVIKTPNSKLQRDKNYSKYLESFDKEAKQIAKLGINPHPHIVRVFDYFAEEDLPCIIMDYVPGESLYDLVQMNGALSEELALKYIRQIGSALGVCHQQGIIHRDVHPNNILIHGESGKAILIDFGISGTTQTSRSNRSGNQAFAPWEQLISFGEQSSKTPQVDIYTLAGSLYYLVTGDTPTPSLARKFNNDELLEPKQHNPKLSDRLNEGILKGLEVEPSDRPQTVKEWLERLKMSPSPTKLSQNTVVFGSRSVELKIFEFDTVKTNDRGEIIKREHHSARYFTEDLGNGITLEMVEIPGGTFMMGSPEAERKRKDDESPQHEVTVPSFYMGKYEVTQAQWKAVAAMPQVERELKLDPELFPSKFKGEELPVEYVIWYDAVEFCKRLSKTTGREYKLPSEAEWEYACRAGTTTPFHFGETITTELVNYKGTDWEYGGKVYPGNYAKGPKGKYREETTPVGSFPPNAFGLYDLHGNVSEWCADRYQESYTGAPRDGSPWVTENSNSYVLRGGSWKHLPRYCRSAVRLRNAPGYSFTTFGFRCIASRTP
jgi:formylglycine-generating enzyme required for sulfatase activity/tRNA A-37 threonylcarbamoyl transferase component Bud32